MQFGCRAEKLMHFSGSEEGDMKTLDEIGIYELRDLLIRNWMTHDGMWFYHCLQELGIEQTNRLNKAAIKSLAEIEIKRAKKIHGLGKDRIDSFQELRHLMEGAFALSVCDFMGATFSFPKEDIMHWEVKDQGCFAYAGMKRLGVIDRYQCGVLYRVFCWIQNAGVQFTASPQIDRCLLHTYGKCSGEIRFSLP